jgi:bifunctional ADP-heptose synthase (sugar kinase/adenylyltransferase)
MSKGIQQQKKLKILLIGDNCIDEYFHGRVKRINPEAPVPLFDIEKLSTKPGMSANVKENLVNIGYEVTHLTNKEEIKKTRYIDSYHNCQILRVDKEPVIKKINLDVLNKLKIEDFSAIIFSDYNKGYLDRDSIIYLFSYFENYDIPVFVDSKKNDISCFSKCFLKINEHEYQKAINIHKDCKLIVTMGEKGAKYKDKIFPSNKLNINDVTKIGDRCGAGDTFLAGLIHQFIKTKDIESSIIFANICASFSVKKIGVYALTRSDIESIRI